MTRLATTPAILGLFVSGMVAAGLPAGCGSNKVEIGLQNVDAQADAISGKGGSTGAGSGGVTGGGGVAATGGTTRTGGIIANGGATQTGGITATGASASIGGTGPAGGTTGAGGATRIGGATGAGGTTPAGGATASGGTGGAGKTCGGLAALPCAAGETCDIQPGHCCCDYTGTCVPQPQVCSALYQPVCGCDGTTYSSDCVRLAAGVAKNFDGACPSTDAAAGGSAGTGGTTGAGGATRTGGTTGTGGATGTGGTGGSTGKTCGGIAGVTCSTGQFCDLLAGSCNVADATGTCVANAGVGCITIYQPVCGCDGKTYPSDCDRQVAGVSKKSDGACPTTDAAVATCSQVTTQAGCDGRSDCHSVFADPGTCGCASAGCCARFSRCADGGRANCTGPVACMAPQPFCEAPYVLSYTGVCYEGCVLQSECAGVDGGVKDVPAAAGVLMTPTLPAACLTDADCCVAMDVCMAKAYLVGQTEYTAMLASIADVSPKPYSVGCLPCIKPLVQVQCKGGFCVGEKLPDASVGGYSHCGYISLSDAGMSTVSTHALVDAGTVAPSTWSCGSP